jgi:hypothetical protein
VFETGDGSVVWGFREATLTSAGLDVGLACDSRGVASGLL